MSNTLYKIVPYAAWEGRENIVPWAQIDRSDGFVHLSAGHQVRETAAKHFARRDDLILVGIDPAAIAEHLKWEPSRGGALFPHVYGDIPLSAVTSTDVLPGVAPEDFPAHVPSGGDAR